MENRKVYIEKMSHKLKEWDDKIKEIEFKAEDINSELKNEFNNNIADLRLKYNNAKQKIDDYRTVGENALEDLKRGIEQSWSILENSFAKAIDKFN